MKSKITLTLMLALVSLSLLAGSGGHKRKVLIIGVDGTRADALVQEIDSGHAPNLGWLANNGFYSFDTWHLDITWSGPSWSSIMTGVYHEKHGVTNNSYAGSNFNQYPYFTTLAKEIDTSFKCVQLCEWAPLVNSVYNDDWDTQIIGTDGYSDGTGQATVAQLQDPNIDVLFTYFDHVDITGHASGFSPANPAYCLAIDTVDKQIGVIMTALRARPNYANENWLVFVVTDHGGIGNSHGGFTYDERHIWWIAYSDRINKMRVSGPQDSAYTNPPDPGDHDENGDTVNINMQRLSPVQVDVGTTALHHLLYDDGINPMLQSAWNLDGKTWLCEMGLCSDLPTGIIDPETTDMVMTLMPNPANNGKFMIYCTNTENSQTVFTISDELGRVVKEISVPGATVKHYVDLSSLAKGIYRVTARSSGMTTTKNLVID